MRNIVRLATIAAITNTETATSILWAAALLSTYENIGKNYHPVSRMTEWADRWHDLYAAYNEEAEPEHWDPRKTFFGDEKLFVDSPEHDDLIGDLFDSTQTVEYRLAKPEDGRKMYSFPVYPNLDAAAIQRLRRAIPVTWRDMPFENQLDLRTMGEMAPNAVFNPMSERTEKRFPVRYGQANRLIVEDCTKSSTGDIQIPQLTRAGDCNIPAHLRLDGIKKFGPMIETFEEAQIMSRVIKALDLDFTQFVKHNIISEKEIEYRGKKRKVKVRKPLSQRINTWSKENGRKPWEAPVGKDGIPLYEIAEELFTMSQQEQENPAWAADMEPDPIARYFPANFTTPDPGMNLDSESTTGEYTYWRVTMIPEAKWFDPAWSSIKAYDFKYALNHIDKMPASQMKRIKDLIGIQPRTDGKKPTGRGNYDQKDKWEAAMRRELNKRAREVYDGPITICPPQLEPIETDEDTLRLYERMDDWQIDEAGRRYEQFQDDPEEDILDDGYDEDYMTA